MLLSCALHAACFSLCPALPGCTVRAHARQPLPAFASLGRSNVLGCLLYSILSAYLPTMAVYRILLLSHAGLCDSLPSGSTAVHHVLCICLVQDLVRHMDLESGLQPSCNLLYLPKRSMLRIHSVKQFVAEPRHLVCIYLFAAANRGDPLLNLPMSQRICVYLLRNLIYCCSTA
jgi:hypothetical protein